MASIHPQKNPVLQSLSLRSSFHLQGSVSVNHRNFFGLNIFWLVVEPTPSEKICLSHWKSSPGRDENETYLKPKPSFDETSSQVVYHISDLSFMLK